MLNRAQLVSFQEALHGGDLGAFNLDGEGHTCIPREAIDKDRAGAAFTSLTADLGSRKADALP